MIITESKLFSSFRRVFSKLGKTAEEFIECPMCVGFWVGLLFVRFTKWTDMQLWDIFDSISTWNLVDGLIYYICMGAMISGVVWIVHCITLFLNPPSDDEEEETEDIIEESQPIELELDSHVSDKLAKEMKEKYDISIVINKSKDVILYD